MKRARLFALAAAIAVFCFGLCACSQTTAASESSSEAKASPFVGTWEIVSQEKVHNEDLEAEKAAGSSRFFILEEDGTVRAEYKGVTTEGTYQETGATSAHLTINDPTWSDKMVIEDPLLVIESADGLRFRFERIDDEERRSYNEQFGY